MLDSRTILIVDDSAYGALALSAAVEDCDGRVAGPIATFEEARSILDLEAIAAAVIDCDSIDGMASPVIRLLAEKGLPLVIQTSGSVPQAIEAVGGRVLVLLKPVDPRLIVESLLVEIGKADQAIEGLRIESPPKRPESE